MQRTQPSRLPGRVSVLLGHGGHSPARQDPAAAARLAGQSQSVRRAGGDGTGRARECGERRVKSSWVLWEFKIRAWRPAD